MNWENIEELRAICSQDEDYVYWLWDHNARLNKTHEPWSRLHELPYRYHELVPRECWWKPTDEGTDEYMKVTNPAFNGLVSYLTVGAVNQLLNTWGDSYECGADVIFNREEYFPVVTRIIPSVAEFMEEYSEWLSYASDHWNKKEVEQIPMPHVIDETNHDAKFYMKHLRVCTWLGGAKCHYLGCGHLNYPAMLMQQGSFSPKGGGWQKSYGYSDWFDTNFENKKEYISLGVDNRPSGFTQVDYELNKRTSLSMLEQNFRVFPRESYPELTYRFGGKEEENV